MIFLCMLLIGCKAEFAKNEDNPKLKTQGTKEVLGTSIGLVDETAQTRTNFTHRLKSSTEYSPEIKIINHYPEKMEYRLFFLLDYKQTKVNYNNAEINYMDIEVEPKNEKKFTIKLSDIPDGLHDFIVISVRNPNNYLTDQQLIPPPRTFIHRRVTILVGENENPPNVKFEEITNDSNVKFKKIDDSSNILRGVVYLTNVPRNTPTGEVITLLNSYQNPLWVNFAIEEPNTSFAIIALLNNEQVVLQSTFFHTASKGMVNYPLNISINKNNPCNLTLAVVENPYTKIEDKNGELQNKLWSVIFANQITFEIEGKN